jgi:DNA-binding MurR/RpiR family transcriptional regulator
MSLDELASTIYVSKSTIIRFCKKLGFHGHKELCVEVAKELNTLGADDIEVDVSMPFSRKDTPMEAARKMMQLSYKAINDTFSGIVMEPLMELASLIHEGRPFTVYAYGENFLPALDISTRLQALGYQISISNIPGTNTGRAISQAPSSAALLISYSGREPMLAQCARILLEKNIPVFLISGPSASSLKRLVDTVIEAGFYEPQPREVVLGSRTALLYILDVLYALVFNLDTEKHTAMLKADYEYRRRNTESAEGL